MASPSDTVSSSLLLLLCEVCTLPVLRVADRFPPSRVDILIGKAADYFVIHAHFFFYKIPLAAVGVVGYRKDGSITLF